MKSSLSLAESFYLSAYQNRFSVLATYCLVVALLAQFSPPSTSCSTCKKPNIIVIMGDDVGYGDVSCNGATAITTPHIDALLNKAYGSPADTARHQRAHPRYSFLTGSYASGRKVLLLLLQLLQRSSNRAPQRLLHYFVTPDTTQPSLENGILG